MWLFEKKITIFQQKNKNEWLKISNALKEAGLKIKAGHYAADTLNPCGCGAKLDPRNFGAKGYIDREVYFIEVRKSELQRAYEIINANGFNAVVENDPVGKLGRI